MKNIFATLILLIGLFSLPAISHAYTIPTQDSVMMQCGGQLQGNSKTLYLTTGQSISYTCPSTTLPKHGTVLVKCNGGNPNGNGHWDPLNIGQSDTIYCTYTSTPSPTPTVLPTTTPTPISTPIPIGKPNPPILMNPQNPINYGADPSGTRESSSSFNNAANSGDLDVPAGTYILNLGLNLNGRNLRCEPGAILKQTVLTANRSMFNVTGSGSIFNCDFRGPYYNVNGAGFNAFFEDFIHVNPPSNGYMIVGNLFNGTAGYTGAVDVYANDAQYAAGQINNGLIIGWNTFSHCSYYAVQITSGENILVENNTNLDCAGYVEADDTGQINTGNLVINNHVTFIYGTGWSNYGSGSYPVAGHWANELTCGQSASGTPYNYSGNTCTNNIVDGPASSMIAETAVSGGHSAKYINNTCIGGCRIN